MSTGQSGKGSVRRQPAKPGTYEEGHAAINWFRREHRLVTDDLGFHYIIPVGEETTFVHWIAAEKGQRHHSDFVPVRVGDLRSLRFTGWREEDAQNG